MRKSPWKMAVALALAVSWPGAALPQSPAPDAVAAAKELIIASKMAEQMNQMLPQIMQQLKPLVVKGNPLAERDFDALMPVISAAMNTHLEAYINSGAQIYARHFTADEMRQVTDFYRTPIGQKLLQKLPQVMQETMAVGQQLGQAVAQDVQKRMIEELRKRGHNI